MTLPFLSIKGFADFQHYKNRRPPWIKFYANVLTDAAMMQLPEAAQAQLFKLWLLASQMGNPLPNNPRFLAGKIGVQGKSFLPLLIKEGFVVPCEALADDAQNASSDASENLGDIEQRERTELETDPAAPPREGVNPVNIAVWCNAAIAERWGEQASPLTPGMAAPLAADVAHVPWRIVQGSIAEQCRASRNATPPKHPNYFKPGILEHQARAEARKDMAAGGGLPPRIRQGKQAAARNDLAAWATSGASNGE